MSESRPTRVSTVGERDAQIRLRKLSVRIDGSDETTDSIEAMRTRIVTLEQLGNPLAYLLAANFNLAGDQELAGFPAKWILRRITAWNPTGAFDIVVGGIYAAPSKGGTVLVAATQTYATLTGVSKFKDLTLEAICGTDWFVESRIYLNLTTLQGSAAVADLAVYGDSLP